MTVLSVRNLSIDIPTGDGFVHAARDVSFDVGAEELFGIAGESGSGKSVLSKAIMGLLPGALISGEILFEGRNLLDLPARAMQQLRGNRIAMISQDPLSSLHPFYTIGAQIVEAIRTHRKVSEAEALKEVIDILGRVGIHDAEKRVHDYPHQFSGGMRQRVMIAMAIVLRPALLIADEPTTALDVTVQAQIISLLNQMRREFGTAIIMVTHDLDLLSSIADHTMVMYAGNRMEFGPGEAVLTAPAHPYTLGLLRSSPSQEKRGALPSIPGQPPSLLLEQKACAFAPRCPAAMAICRQERPPLRTFADGTQSLCWLEDKASNTAAALAPVPAEPAALVAQRDIVVSAKDVRLTYGGRSLFGRRINLEVLKGVSLELPRGTTLGIVGESGCGKSTLARIIAGLLPPTSGEVTIEGESVVDIDRARWIEMRKRVQMVFQDPFGSLNPRRRVGSIIGDPFRIQNIAHGIERKNKVRELMEIVGLNPEHYNRFPAEFSGGQRQRIGIARALALKPSIIIFDEPVSALDVSIQAQILNLIGKLQREMGLSYLFISHDLAVVRHVSSEIMVMKSGQVVERGETETLYHNPQHPYTRELLAAADPHYRKTGGGLADALGQGATP
ncbi:Glutathione import ATP-binding protein GsiA [Devosia equisanguinis]|uniref:Glutathione import ATP-binding protein GsiA n=1 Tax=Devosia equisanguinis TaxID=2490941 RepID=A0A447IE33_9HYPH|nr:ABC transporter ATP-binding protein [Devosia equisanguinis]VDS05692.1 Glutathione import ATP-binding protein GsiA [Devosia equisanguinis]